MADIMMEEITIATSFPPVKSESHPSEFRGILPYNES
jgi:hypothetical protein